MNTERPFTARLLHVAEYGSIHDIEALLQNPTLDNINLMRYGHEAVQIATRYNRVEVVQRLLQHPHIRAGRSLVYAISRNNPELIQLLLHHPSTDIDIIQNAIDIAVITRHEDSLQYILRDPRTQSQDLRDFLWIQLNKTATINNYLNDQDKSLSVQNILTNHWITYFQEEPLPDSVVSEYSDNRYWYMFPTPEKTWTRRRHALLTWHMVNQYDYV